MNSAIPRLSVFVAISCCQKKKIVQDRSKGSHTFVSSFLQLLVLSGLLNKLKDLKNEWCSLKN